MTDGASTPGLSNVLRLTPARWDAVDRRELPYRGLMTVVGGWLLMACARFGIQGVTAPRALVRFVLVGVYTWLAMAALVAAVGWLANRRGRPGPQPDVTRSLQFAGLVSQPIVILGFALLIGQVIPVPALFTMLAVLTLLLWLPGLLLAAMASAFGRLDRLALGAAAAAYVLWATTAGRYLLDRVGHLF
ncbi:MAG: hypothetical protein AAGA93_06660 [Actinomycetota bacterium]